LRKATAPVPAKGEGEQEHGARRQRGAGRVPPEPAGSAGLSCRTWVSIWTALIAAKGFDKQQQILVAVNLLCESDERRKTYQVIVDDVQARHRGLFPHPACSTSMPIESAVNAIYNKLQDARESPDVSALLQDLYSVVDTALTTDGNQHAPCQPAAMRYDLSNIDFSRLRAEFEKSPFKNVVTLNLKEKIEERLAMMLARNPTRVDLYERYQEIIQEYNKDKDAAEIQKVMDDLFTFNDNLDEEEKRYLREGLDSEDQLAVFDLLQKDTPDQGRPRRHQEGSKGVAGQAEQRQAADRPLARKGHGAGPGQGRDHQALVRVPAVWRLRRGRDQPQGQRRVCAHLHDGVR
jgi:type I restriction enzyme R subunit